MNKRFVLQLKLRTFLAKVFIPRFDDIIQFKRFHIRRSNQSGDGRAFQCIKNSFKLRWDEKKKIQFKVPHPCRDLRSLFSFSLFRSCFSARILSSTRKLYDWHDELSSHAALQLIHKFEFHWRWKFEGRVDMQSVTKCHILNWNKYF